MKKSTFSNKKTFILLGLAAILLLGSTVGSTQAALTYYSENYQAEVTVSNIGVTLMENGEEISRRNYLKDDKWDETTGTLFTNLAEDDEKLVLGKSYEEELVVKNSGAIDVYVRVILKKSWLDAEGKKNTTLSPDLICFNLLTGDNGWVVDEKASTAERTVLYYTKPLAVDAKTPACTDALWIDPVVGTKVIETVETVVKDGKEYKTITYVHEYDGLAFQVEAEVDAVQTHNAEAAITSAWGVSVKAAEDGTISLQ